MKNYLFPILFAFPLTCFAQNNVGIGTSTPIYKLHVHETSAGNDANIGISNAFTGSAAGQGGRIRFFNSDFILINQESVGNMQFVTNSFTRVLINSSGNVGVGTITPAERLHVRQTGDFNKNVIYGYANQTSSAADYENTGVTGFGEGNGIANGFGYAFGVKGIGSTNSWGAVGVYAGLETTVPTSLGVGNAFYALFADARTPPGLNRYAGVFMNGNVGIGTLSPSERLVVYGNINLNGALQISNNSGSAGQVLVSNGASMPTWENLANPQVGFSAVLLANQVIANSTTTVLTPYGEFFDTQNNFDPATGAFTAPVAGVYHFDVTLSYTSLPASGNSVIGFLINGLSFGGSNKPVLVPGTASSHAITHSVTIPLLLGQVVTYTIFQDTGVPVTARGGPDPRSSCFSGFRIY